MTHNPQQFEALDFSGKLGALYQSLANLDEKMDRSIEIQDGQELRIRDLESFRDTTKGEQKQSRWDLRTVIMMLMLFITMVSTIIGGIAVVSRWPR